MMRPVLRRGDDGDGVAQLQQALLDEGFDPGPVDGVFEDGTEQAVLDFQADRELDVDGVVGPATWDALGVVADEPVEEPVEEPSDGARTDWAMVNDTARMRYVMTLLVEHHGYPVNGAAGIVGNLWAESGVMPNRVEGSSSATPMRARNFAGDLIDFSTEEVRNRSRDDGVGPARPGVGLAQWTSPARRRGLFSHAYDGQVLGEEILWNMDAQVDYLVEELQTSYPGVHAVVSDASVLVDDACDEVVYRFEIPGSVLDAGTKLPRTDPRVQHTFEERRTHGHRAARSYQEN